MSKVIIYKQDNGIVTVIHPSPEALELYGIEAIAQKDVPHNLSYKIVEDDVIQTDREFRNAWTIDDEELTDGVGGELNTFEELA